MTEICPEVNCPLMVSARATVGAPFLAECPPGGCGRTAVVYPSPSNPIVLRENAPDIDLNELSNEENR